MSFFKCKCGKSGFGEGFYAPALQVPFTNNREVKSGRYGKNVLSELPLAKIVPMRFEIETMRSSSHLKKQSIATCLNLSSNSQLNATSNSFLNQHTLSVLHVPIN